MNVCRVFPNQSSWEQRRSALVEKIYATIADPQAWPHFLRELVACTGSRSARLLVLNAEATCVNSSIKLNIDDSYHQQYTNHYVNTCPWRPELVQKPPGRLYSTYLHFSCPQADFYRSEFYNDWARPQDIHHGVCGTIYQDMDQTVQLLVQRTGGQGHYTEQETAFFNEFIPHLQQAFLLAGEIAFSRSKAEAVAVAAQAESLPFCLLDSALRLIHASPGAEALLNKEAALSFTDGQLRLTDGLCNQALQRLLRTSLTAAETRAFDSSGGMLDVPRPNRSALKLLVRPIHPDIPLLTAALKGFVALYLYDPEAEIAIDGERLRDLYALSEAEIRVATVLLATPDPAEVARRCCLSLHTVRSHLKAIFAKTDTKNQASLVKRLLASPGRKPSVL